MIEHIAKPTKLYRVGSPSHGQGLWYDENGRETGRILRLNDGKAGLLPMGPHPWFRLGGRHWISVTDSLEKLENWFSYEDCHELIAAGYELLEIIATAHLRFTFETYGYSHEVYCAEEATRIRAIPFDAWNECRSDVKLAA